MKLQCVLDGNNTFVIGQEFNESIEQRGLARSGTLDDSRTRVGRGAVIRLSKVPTSCRRGAGRKRRGDATVQGRV